MNAPVLDLISSHVVIRRSDSQATVTMCTQQQVLLHGAVLAAVLCCSILSRPMWRERQPALLLVFVGCYHGSSQLHWGFRDGVILPVARVVVRLSDQRWFL